MFEPKFHFDDGSDDDFVATPKQRFPVGVPADEGAKTQNLLKTVMRKLTPHSRKQGCVKTPGLSMSAKKAYSIKEGLWQQTRSFSGFAKQPSVESSMDSDLNWPAQDSCKVEALPLHRQGSRRSQQDLSSSNSPPDSRSRLASACAYDRLSRHGSACVSELLDAQCELPKAGSRTPMLILAAILAILLYLV
mmetsp:Transcript_10955/g.30065  ORF Transcript_10955/g.30065 Transcript_10955/m.30065 type:complete len:191 (-) Transcript_10955:914-1486(-)